MDELKTRGLEFIKPHIGRLAKFSAFTEALQAGKTDCVVVKPLRPALIAAAFEDTDKTFLVVTSDSLSGETLCQELRNYLENEKAAFFPDIEAEPYELISPNIESIGERLRVLSRVSGAPMIMVCSIRSLARKVPDRDYLAVEPIKVSKGMSLEMDSILGKLIDFGYVNTAIVEDRGGFARRGSLIDVFPSTGEHPVRLDFFGDTVESIRTFSLDDQRSIEERESVEIYAAREFTIEETVLETYRQNNPGFEREVHENEKEAIIQRHLPNLIGMTGLMEILPRDLILVAADGNFVAEESIKYLKNQEAAVNEMLGANSPLKSRDYFVNEEVIESIIKNSLRFEELITSGTGIVFESSYPPEAAGRIDVLDKNIKDLIAGGLSVALAVNDIGEWERLGQLLDESGIGWSASSLTTGRPLLTIAACDQGFIINEVGLAVLGQRDIFPRHLAPQRLSYVSRKKSIIDFSGLKKGDYLVHEIHGIAVFMGLMKKEISGITREYLILEYGAGDKLFLPTDQLHKISRYIGPDTGRPKITRLGSTEWIKAKKKARASVKKLAIDLKALYTQRLKGEGYSFSKDTTWQRELESAFPFEETIDQLSAIEAVKGDMESSLPMDRLVCGDVGYGKTEVAIRAAFKTILDSKQVMMLAPTTILAQQHYMTFRERFAPFPVEVEMLSRFRTTKDKNQVIKKIKSGQVDFVVGTHRLLQKDVDFNDLGLVIIDEEQRFGVGQKEHIKELKKSVDVLTLTATPIPRTLQMSLSGVRDLSVIDTPPEGRHPVVTYVGEYQKGMVRSAISRELNRGGQIFYLFNRVDKIEGAARRVKDLVPEAKVIIGHGQMSEKELERVMVDFLERKADVLVCTTIIESGLDIPNANTLVIEDADKLGLAQLYQLRGRVGRAHHQAYAYFTFSPGTTLSGTSLERLRSIAKFTELGSGFKIALRDLEIRGAGNLLGAEQHGQMSAVGFELYCRMLKEAVDELEGKPIRVGQGSQIDLPVEAAISSDYVSDENLRLDVYRSIAGCADDAEILRQREELRDRFGELPKQVDTLLLITKLRLLAERAAIRSISYKSRRLIFRGVAKDTAAALHERIKEVQGVNYKESLGEFSFKTTERNDKLVLFILNLISAIIPQT